MPYLALLTLALTTLPGGTEAVDFDTQVRPLLARRCFVCHGFDSSTRKSGLRLDDRDQALRGGRKADAAFVPGDPDASVLVQRISSGDPDFRMPPDEMDPLTAAEQDMLRRWIAEGAPYTVHWSLRAVARPPVPDVADESWPRDDIDRFVLARLESAGLRPAPEADRATILRRLSFDLIGLPPTPEELSAFAEDLEPGAYERAVDRLLASPHFGERWGRHWLDLMRYAETHGHEYDYPIQYAWQYRDYVIRALNADVPYDVFVTEHIAGDLLDAPRRHPTERYNESIIGTGFWFLSQGTHAPVDSRADEAIRIDNQIDVITKSFLGATVSCARCHDHKFDPITTREYYGLYGFLQSSRRQEAYLDPGERIALAMVELHGRQAAAARARRALLDDGDPPTFALVAAALEVARSEPPPDDGSDDGSGAASEHGVASEPIDARAAVAAERGVDAGVLARWAAALSPPAQGGAPDVVRALVAARDGDAWTSTADAGAAEGVIEDFDGGITDWFPSGFAWNDQGSAAPAGIASSRVHGAHAQGTLRSPTFELTGDAVTYRLRGVGPGTRIRMIVDGYVLDEYNALLFGGFTFPAETEGGEWVVHRQDVPRVVGHRAWIEFDDEGDGWLEVDWIRFGDPPAPQVVEPPDAGGFADACAAALDAAREGVRDELADWLIRHRLVGTDTAHARLDAALADVQAADERVPAPMRVLAIQDGTAEDEHVFVRGDHRQLGPVAPRTFIEAFGGGAPVDSSAGSGRLDLARRMLAADNPLATRAAVNRVWHHLFGRGIVPTPDDLGALGQAPTHPALLDFLADWFHRDGAWSTKAIIRRVVCTSTYRMAAIGADPAAADVDPANRLLHAARVRRLEGEAIRDAVLAVSGRLDPTLGGPPVPLHLTPFMQGRGRPGQDGPIDGDGRRSIYMAVRRNFLSPMMLAFDAPVPHSTVGRRSVSNVPAQSLTMMNDPFVVAQARVWAQRILADRALVDAPTRIDRMFREALARPPAKHERSAMLDYVRASKSDDEQTWADVAHVLYNLKEFIYIQ